MGFAMIGIEGFGSYCTGDALDYYDSKTQKEKIKDTGSAPGANERNRIHVAWGSYHLS